MKDLNFFNSYTDKKGLKVNKQRVYYSLVIIIIAIISVYSIYNQIKIRSISREIVKLKTVTEDKRMIKKIDEVIQKENELNQLKSSLNNLRILDNYVEDTSIIDDYLLEVITSNIPTNVFFTSISMDVNDIQIIGTAEDQLAVGQLIENLDSIKIFNNVFVPTISKDEEHYNFMLNIRLKEVNIDGENTGLEETEAQENTN